MRIDHFLDGDRAGHGGLAAEQCRGGAEGIACGMPERPEGRRPHPAIDQELVEDLEMAALLGGHMLDRGARGPWRQHGELAIIDSPRAVFAGLVDADGARHAFGGGGVAGQTPAGCHGRRIRRSAALRQIRPSVAA